MADEDLLRHVEIDNRMNQKGRGTKKKNEFRTKTGDKTSDCERVRRYQEETGNKATASCAVQFWAIGVSTNLSRFSMNMSHKVEGTT